MKCGYLNTSVERAHSGLHETKLRPDFLCKRHFDDLSK